jgi:hypothetical protein
LNDDGWVIFISATRLAGILRKNLAGAVNDALGSKTKRTYSKDWFSAKTLTYFACKKLKLK